MKNIHILPTDKPSRLYLGNNGNFVFGMIQTSIQSRNDDFTNQDLYITSDEEIKEGDWVITPTNDIIEWAKVFRPNGKKIILTTNKKLIRYGVQAIDDDFLEWFVKNPSCESVVVKYQYWKEINDVGKYTYKIIIPKEEPKQETVERGIDFGKELSKWGYNKGNSIDVEILVNEILPDLFKQFNK